MHSWSILLMYTRSYGHKEKRSITQSLDLLSGVGMKELHVVGVRELSSCLDECSMYALGCVLKQKHNFLDNTISSRPDLAATSYVLMTTHPRRELTDDTQTLSDANLLNALIIQRKT